MMEFKIQLQDDIAAERPQPGGAQPPSTGGPSAPQASGQQSLPPQLQSIERTLLPALAAAAPKIARELYAEANQSAPLVSPFEAQPAIEAEALQAFGDMLRGDMVPALEELRLAPEPKPLAPVEAMEAYPAKEVGFSSFFDVPQEGFLDSFVQQALERLQAGKELMPAPLQAGKELMPAPLENKLTEAWKTGVAQTFDALKQIAQRHFDNAPARASDEGIPRAGAVPAKLALGGSRDNPDLDEAFGFARTVPEIGQPANEAATAQASAQEMGRAAGHEMAKEILPALEELTIAGREEGDILPALEDLHPLRASPTEEASLAQHMTYKEARSITYRDDETEAPSVRSANVAGEAAEVGGAEEGMAVAAEGGALAAAGPVGIAIGAAALAAQGMAKTLDGVRHGVQLFGDEMALVAHNDYIGGFTHAVDFAADSLKEIPIAGELASSALHLVSATVGAFEKSVESFIDRGKEIARFSPEIMAADIRSELRGMQADMHEADVLGPELARLTDGWSEFTAELRELFLPIKEALATFLADVMEDLKDAAKGLKPFMEVGTEAFKVLLKVLLWFIEHSPLGLIAAIGRTLDKIEGNTRKEDQKPSDYVSWLFDVKAYAEAITDAAREAGPDNPLWNNGVLNVNAPI